MCDGTYPRTTQDQSALSQLGGIKQPGPTHPLQESRTLASSAQRRTVVARVCVWNEVAALHWGVDGARARTMVCAVTRCP